MRPLIVVLLLLILGFSFGCTQPSAFVCNSYVDLDDDKVADRDEFLGKKDRFNYGESITAILQGVSIAEGKESLEVRMRLLGFDGEVKQDRTSTLSEKGARVLHFPLEAEAPGKYLVVFSGDGKVIARTEFEIVIEDEGTGADTHTEEEPAVAEATRDLNRGFANHSEHGSDIAVAQSFKSTVCTRG